MCFIVWNLVAYMKRLINLQVCCKIFNIRGCNIQVYKLTSLFHSYEVSNIETCHKRKVKKNKQTKSNKQQTTTLLYIP